MKVYKIKVNGKLYEVEVESITEIEKKSAPVVTTTESKVKILSPMQGTIVKSNVAVGSKVKKDEVLMVLESMKLESDILSPTSGYVRQVLVVSGQKVEINQLLLVIG